MDLQGLLDRASLRRKQATHELVAAVLREGITSGVLRANEPLPQDEIAAQLQVSHIPVREALRQLQSEGLVTYQPNRGATVSALTPEEIRELYEIRTILETATIRRAAPHIAPERLAKAAAVLDAAERASDDATWGALDVEFHELIYDFGDRPRLRELIDGLLRRVDRYWLTYGLMLKHRTVFEREHRELLGAVGARNADLAVAILARHLTGASDRLISELGRIDGAKGGPPGAAPVGDRAGRVAGE